MSRKLFTIGHSNHNIENFIQLLKENQVTAIADVRSSPYSRYLSHFNKAELEFYLKDAEISYVFLGKELGARPQDEKCYKDLEYFLKEIASIDYLHILDLAPTKDILDNYKKKKGDWETYEKSFLDLMKKRQIENRISPEILDGGCLLCSEAKPHNCHRRLVAEYLNNKLGNINISHL